MSIPLIGEAPDYCDQCPRRFGVIPGKSGACRADGNLDAPILFVGMAPGTEELGGVPFVGKSGALLWGVGQKVGITRANARVFNVSNCWPCARKGKDLSEAQIGACWNRFDEDLMASSPRVIVCLGGDALRRVTGLVGINKYRGFLLKREHLRSQVVSIPTASEYKTSRKNADGTWKFQKGDKRWVSVKQEINPNIPDSVEYIIATYHPSAVMRAGRKNMRAFLNDLDRAVRALNGELDIRTYDYVTHPIPMEGNVVAFDIENIGGLEGAISRIGFAAKNGVWTADWNHEVREATRRELSDPNRIKVGHNLQHDIPHLEAEGVEVPGLIFDTMWGGMTLEPDLPMGLRSMVPLWLDAEGCWKDEGFDKKTGIVKNPDYYNAYDNGYTYDLALRLIERHKQKGSYDALMKWIMPSLRVLMDMHRTGMKVDVEWLGNFSHRLRNRRIKLERLWFDHVPSINPGSNVEVGKYLYGHLGLDVIKDPDNENKPTTAAWALKLLIQRYPAHTALLRTLLALRKVEKLQASTMVKLGNDGALHPRFGPHWKDEQDAQSKRKGTTSTLRLAVAGDGGLNIQQIPEYARRMYVAPPGYVFLKVDIDRAEPWIYAVRSGDMALQRKLREGDPYRDVAATAGVDRDVSKILFLARTYGARERKGQIILWKRGYDADQKLVRRVFNAIANQYPRTEAYRNKVGSLATTRGYLQSGFGFVREFLGGDRDIPEAMDWEAQHHVAMILWTLFQPVHQMAKSFGGWMAITVYDEVLIAVPEESARKAGRALVEIMRTERPEIAPGFRPAISEVLVGTNWRDMTPLEVT